MPSDRSWWTSRGYLTVGSNFKPWNKLYVIMNRTFSITTQTKPSDNSDSVARWWGGGGEQLPGSGGSPSPRPRGKLTPKKRNQEQEDSGKRCNTQEGGVRGKETWRNPVQAKLQGHAIALTHLGVSIWRGGFSSLLPDVTSTSGIFRSSFYKKVLLHLCK